MEIINQYFLAALHSCLERQPRGIKAKLARAAGISISQLVDILKKRSYGSENTRRKISSALGYQYEDLLDLGKRIVDGGAGSENITLPRQNQILIDDRTSKLIKQVIYISQHMKEELIYLETISQLIIKIKNRKSGSPPNFDSF
jgi:transcriptional regulator with XRE-family HTH domain